MAEESKEELNQKVEDIKKHVFGGYTGHSNSDDAEGAQEVIHLQFPPEFMCRLYNNSAYLRPNIDAYAQNIDGFGHIFKPIIDLKSEDAPAAIKKAMMLEKWFEQEALVESGDQEEVKMVEISDAEVEAKMDSLEVEMTVEKWKLDSAFEAMVDETSFVELRKWLRTDKETTGNAYVEVRRDLITDKPAKMSHLASCSIKPMPLHKAMVEVSEVVSISPLQSQESTTERRFRRFQQHTNSGNKVYYKEYGDPRIMGKLTGRYFKDQREFDAYIKTEDGSDEVVATEVIWFKIHNPGSSAGVPRWAGVTPEVLGSREAGEVNLSWLMDKGIPPVIIAVSGGKLGDGISENVRDFLANECKGKGNYHKAFVIEADGSPNKLSESANNPKIEVIPVAQVEDGLFQEYDQNNGKKIKGSFRNPGFLVGDTENVNFATATAARLVAEEQVYQPERAEFDQVMNKTVVKDMGSKYHKMQSNSPEMKNPEAMTKIITEFTKEGILTPEESRELAEDVINKELPNIDADWVKQPQKLTLAGFPVDGSPAVDVTDEVNKQTDLNKAALHARNLKAMYSKLKKRQEDEAYEVETIKISQERFNELINAEPQPEAGTI